MPEGFLSLCDCANCELQSYELKQVMTAKLRITLEVAVTNAQKLWS